MNRRGNPKHGGHGTITYFRWRSMIARCYQVNASNYKYYGAHGISVWQPWRDSFNSFLEDMGECPSKEMTLERIDNSIGYTPKNCIWATKRSQNRNRSHCISLTHAGRTQILVDWANEIGMSANTLAMRIRLGWSTERALTQPVKKRTTRK